MKTKLTLFLSLFLSAWVSASDSANLMRFAPLQGKLDFSQEKNIQGLPVALKSSGYLQINEDNLLWHTQKPVDTKLLISASGVSQWQQQDYKAIAGSEFVGQLLLAVLQQKTDFIVEHFSLKTLDKCMELTPRMAPLNQLFLAINLCGEQNLEHLTLHELNGNRTAIMLTKSLSAN